MIAKCPCEHCGVNIEFATEEFLSGSTIACPTCNQETTLSVIDVIVNCPCQHCAGGIEFNASGLAEENSQVLCPHCGLETKLFVPVAAESLIQKLPVETESFVEQEQADSIANTDAAKAVKAAQLKEIMEIANRRLIYSHLDSLELRGEIITIKKRGVANALASGMNGARSIQISSVTAIQMKPASMMTVGYILFTYAGHNPAGGESSCAVQNKAWIFTAGSRVWVA